MFQKFESPTWLPLQNDDTIQPDDLVEDLVSGKREVVGKSKFYQFLTGQRAGQARHLPEVFDIVRAA